LGAAKAVISVDKFSTPRWVWVNSAIAATLCHSLLAWWGLSAWQQRRITAPTPTPIQIITLSPAATAPAPATTTDSNPTARETVSEPTSPTGSQATAPAPTLPSAAGAVAATNNRSPVQPQPVTPRQTPVSSQTPVAPATVQPSAPSVVPTSPMVTPTPNPQPSSPSPPTTAGAAATPTPSPAANPPSSSSSPPIAAPPTSPVTAVPPISPVPRPEVPPTSPPSNAGNGNSNAPSSEVSAGETQGGLQSWWSLQPVPGGGSDIHDKPPQMPTGWQGETAALLQNATCASGLIPSGTSLRVTLWPAVDAQGQIMQFLPRADNASLPNSVLQCVEDLAPQMPPLIPAQDGGVVVASDEVLLVIELRSPP
jgi:hypothetical protein